MICRNIVFLALAVCALSRAQSHDYPDYQDYANEYEGQDNLYQGYAERAEQKAVG